MNRHAYRWEYVDLEQGIRREGTAARSRYFEHVAARAPYEAARDGARLVGLFGEVGITGEWPRCLVLREFDDLASLARHAAPSFAAEDVQATWRVEAESKWLRPAAFSPTLAGLLAGGVTGTAFLQQTVRLRPRAAEAFLVRLERLWLPAMQGMGARLVGAWSSGLCGESEVISFWALRDFNHWAQVQNGFCRAPARALRDQLDIDIVERRENLFFPAPGMPLSVPA